MWAVDLSPEHPFVYSIFGVQYDGEEPNGTKKALIDTLGSLISKSASYVDSVEQDHMSALGIRSRIWLAYWLSPAEYEKWWGGEEMAPFWDSLADDAGVWREILTVPKTRTQFGTNIEENIGLGALGKLVPNTTKSGYWGCYRDRIEEATPTNRLKSSIPAVPEPIPESNQIRSGRVKMDHFPDNLCFVIEGQDHSPISDDERVHWFQNFDKPATKWITDVVTSGPQNGMVSARLCYAPESGEFREKSPLGLSYNRKIQILYFLDFGYMERIGKNNKGHVGLRSNFMQSYSPVGPMANIGKILLWVETSVLKSKEIEAEYVGCYEGTGFMAYDEDPSFGSQSKKQGWLNWITGGSH